jgi:hypothetical protein
MKQSDTYNAWVAGFWEGEGSLIIKGKTCHVSLAQAITFNRTTELLINNLKNKFVKN